MLDADSSQITPSGEGEHRKLRRIELSLRPDGSFPVPYSDGYSVYAALLAALQSVDRSAGDRVHDSQLGSLHSSGLVGPFGDSDRSHHKRVLGDRTYRLTLGIVDPADQAIFQALIEALVLEGDGIELTNGRLRVESFESENATHEELLQAASKYDDPTIEMTFRTPTCIEEAGEVTTMFPHRWALFNSLQGKWRNSSPDHLDLNLSRSEVESHVIEKPDPGREDGYCLDTHSVLVNRVENDDGENRNLFSQGFSGACAYEFKGASESVENAVTALALFGEYSGVGSAVARGCGNINTVFNP